MSRLSFDARESFQPDALDREVDAMEVDGFNGSREDYRARQVARIERDYLASMITTEDDADLPF